MARRYKVAGIGVERRVRYWKTSSPDVAAAVLPAPPRAMRATPPSGAGCHQASPGALSSRAIAAAPPAPEPDRFVDRRVRLSYLFGRVCAHLPAIDYARLLVTVVDTAALPAMPRGYSARPLGPCDLDRLPTDADAAVRANRFGAGMTCVGVFDRHGALAAVLWLGRRTYDEGLVHVRFRLPADAAWDLGLWIPEERRMSRAFTAIWAAARSWLDEQGLCRSISGIADYNGASIAAHRRLGATVICRVVALRIGPFRLVWRDGRRWSVAPAAHWVDIPL